MINKKTLSINLLQLGISIMFIVMYYWEAHSAATWKKIAIDAIQTSEESNNGLRECVQAMERCVEITKKCKKEE